MQTLLRDYERDSTHRCQRERIIALLRRKGYVYTQELVKAGIYQYNARIKELRELGYGIISQKRDGKFGFLMVKGAFY